MLRRVFTLSGSPARVLTNPQTSPARFGLHGVRRTFSSTPASDPLQNATQATEANATPTVGLPAELTQQAYRYHCSQRLSSVDHPTGTLFLLPWDKARLLPLEEFEDPFAPETKLPTAYDRLHDPMLAKVSQRVVHDLRIRDVLLDVQEKEEWQPEEDRVIPEPSLLEHLTQRLGSDVALHQNITPEDLTNLQLHHTASEEKMKLAFTDFRANRKARNIFLGEKFSKFGRQGRTVERAFQAFLHSHAHWPKQLKQELFHMQWRILNELTYTNNNMIGWETGRLVMRHKTQHQARHILDQAQEIIREKSTARDGGKTGNNLLLILRPILVREILRTCNDELRLPITCLAPYPLDGLPMTTVDGPVRDLSRAAWDTGEPLYNYTRTMQGSERLTNLMNRVDQDPVHILRHLWLCFARLNRGDPKLNPTAAIKFRQSLAEFQERGVKR